MQECVLTFIGVSGVAIAEGVVFGELAQEYRKRWLKAKAATVNRVNVLPPDTNIPEWNRGDKVSADELVLVLGDYVIWLPDVAAIRKEPK